MRVLWFADVQLPAVTGAPRSGGGWIEGLRRTLEVCEPDVELAIASPGPIEHAPFSAGNSTYFHIAAPSPDSRIATIVGQWRNNPVPSAAVARCEEIALAYAPDVVHVHGAEHYFGLAIPRLRAPAVVSLQGMATVYQRFVLSPLDIPGIVREVLTREFILRGGGLHLHSDMRARALVERRIVASCDDFMGRTEWDRAVLRMLRPEARYHEVGEVLGAPFYDTEWSGPPAGPETLYCTAGDSPLKGVETLLEALALLRRSGARSPRLRLAGGVGDGPMARKIAKMLASPELRGAVDVLGRCTPAQIVEELARASMFVLPSHMDNSPNALCEAMIVGTPCIAAYVGGVPSLVRDGVDGLLYHDADPYALAGKIDRLLGEPSLAVRLGVSGRERALRRHDPATIAAQAMGAYRSLLRQRCEGQSEMRATRNGDAH
jgi:glycosyltransferase involved in cell wall biosynthesis